MRATWVGAAFAAAAVLALGWGLAGMVGMECAPHPKAGACAIPDSGWKYLAAFVAGIVVLVVPIKAGFYRTDWRPALGVSVGAVAGTAVVLSMGSAPFHWIFALVLIAAGALAPWLARYNTGEAVRARREARKERLREERRERARVRRRERRRERRQRQRSEP